MQPQLTRSFGRRKARKLRETSQQAYDDILPCVRIDFELPTHNHRSVTPAMAGIQQSIEMSMDPRLRGDDTSGEDHQLSAGHNITLFQSIHSETWLEIGFGGGEHLLEQLALNPDITMVGCEPFMNGVAKLLTHLAPEDYDRVRIWHEDVRYLLDHVPSSYFARAFILFPDPWPKKRHHPRRLITQEFIAKLLPSLKEGALLHVASDDVSYVEQIQDVLYSHPELRLCEGPLSADSATWSPRPESWPMTRYEQKAVTQGKKCAYMVFQKKEKT